MLFMAFTTTNNCLLITLLSHVPYFLEIINHIGIFGGLGQITDNAVL